MLEPMESLEEILLTIKTAIHALDGAAGNARSMNSSLDLIGNLNSAAHHAREAHIYIRSAIIHRESEEDKARMKQYDDLISSLEEDCAGKVRVIERDKDLATETKESFIKSYQNKLQQDKEALARKYLPIQ